MGTKKKKFAILNFNTTFMKMSPEGVVVFDKHHIDKVEVTLNNPHRLPAFYPTSASGNYKHLTALAYQLRVLAGSQLGDF